MLYADALCGAFQNGGSIEARSDQSANIVYVMATTFGNRAEDRTNLKPVCSPLFTHKTTHDKTPHFSRDTVQCAWILFLNTLISYFPLLAAILIISSYLYAVVQYM